MKAPLIYNLFPRLVGSTDLWAAQARRACEMAFNWLYINPWHYPGFSGSLYAPKEIWRLNPLFLPEGADALSLEPLRQFLAEMRELRMPVMMDLVINHTSKDSPLIDEHPDWFLRDDDGQVVSPFVVDPDDPEKKTVWGDLAEVDNESSPDRDALWAFWADLVQESLRLGFSGFRCDAAYKVPPGLWRFLIGKAHEIDPEAVFFAETLGAPEEDVVALREAGFHYFFNSSKYWDFEVPWALDQHERFGAIAPSIAFPESHDTTRLAGDTRGDEAVQRQRYAFCAAFSAGLMMPIGYELGFRTQVNVVETTPADWETGAFDLRQFVTRVNRLKLSHPLLQGEGRLRAANGLRDDVLVLERRSAEAAGQVGWIIVNKRTDRAAGVDLFDEDEAANAAGHRLFRVCRDGAREEGESILGRLELDRAEVAYLLPVAA